MQISLLRCWLFIRFDYFMASARCLGSISRSCTFFVFSGAAFFFAVYIVDDGVASVAALLLNNWKRSLRNP